MSSKWCERKQISFLSLYSYTEARKDREKFRKKLTEVIMHRDEWDDEDAEPGTYTRYLVGFFTYKVARKSLGLLEVFIKEFLRCTKNLSYRLVFLRVIQSFIK